MQGKLECPACGAAFATEVELKQHGAMHMSSPSGGAHASFACKACGAHFHSEPDLKAHAAEAHRM